MAVEMLNEDEVWNKIKDEYDDRRSFEFHIKRIMNGDKLTRAGALDTILNLQRVRYERW